MSKPWIAENGYLYAYCYVADYQCSGPAFGYLDWEFGTYVFDDGDSYQPDLIAGTGVHFFNSNLLLSLLETHFGKTPE